MSYYIFPSDDSARELTSTLRVGKRRQTDFVLLSPLVAERSQRLSRDSTSSRSVASLTTGFGPGFRQVHADDVDTAAVAKRDAKRR